MFENVSLEECYEVAVGSEDEMIARIDAERNEEYEADRATAQSTLIEAVHVARRHFSDDKDAWSWRANLENWMDDYND